MVPHSTDLYAAHVRFLSDGSLTVRVWLVPEKGRQAAVELPPGLRHFSTSAGADRIDQACFYIGSCLRRRRDEMASRARQAALAAISAANASTEATSAAGSMEPHLPF